LTDWLLVLAIALAPLQGAFSAFGDTCEHESRVVTTDTGSHANADDMAGHEHGGTGSAQDCCSQDCNCSGCAGVCNLAHASSFLPPSNPAFLNNRYQSYEPQHMTSHIGRTVPTLFRPPRTSV